jgi:hypothetical protein
MNTEQSYETVAPGATARPKTNLFNADRTKIFITPSLSETLDEPQEVNKLRTCLRSWFLCYLDNQDGHLNSYSPEQNACYYEYFDDYFSKLMGLLLGFFPGPDYGSNAEVNYSPTIADQPIGTNEPFLVKAYEITEKMDALADLIFGNEILKTAGEDTLRIAMEVNRGLKEVDKMLSEIPVHIYSNPSGS